MINVIAQGKDPKSCWAGKLGGGEVVTISADDDAREILHTMGSHKVRCLVMDAHRLVGKVALADVAKALPETPGRRPNAGPDH
ncbi:CBS domain-containing protein [Herbidospora galbida]|uniref:CBS domain-containing protein n=1 Tax=Herbidospora galbida TaxID=2575442 RepID=UPI001BAF6DCA|nr:CBS domain-containing protein [Herbidospora galbida]